MIKLHSLCILHAGGGGQVVQRIFFGGLLTRPLFCDQLVITTVTLPVTCHIGLREATFSHENMPVSRKKYHKTWGALDSDKKLA